MNLIQPRRRVCEGKTTKYPVNPNDPFLWLKRNDKDFSVVSIDGYIVNQSKNINGIFKKLEFEYTSGNELNEITIDDLLQAINVQELILFQKLAETFNCVNRIFLWPKDFPKNFDHKSKVVISISLGKNDSGDIYIRNQIIGTIGNLEAMIAKLRGFSFKSVKNLLSAETNMECYLANATGNPWPGDIDSIIFSKKTNEFVSIIEFKTHNGPSEVSNEHIGKYGDQDWRRFEVLYSIKEKLKQVNKSTSPSIFFIVWGSRDLASHNYIKIDLIDNNKVLQTSLISRPVFGKYSSDLFDELIKLNDEA